jgi:hypothetical protein
LYLVLAAFLVVSVVSLVWLGLALTMLLFGAAEAYRKLAKALCPRSFGQKEQH